MPLPLTHFYMIRHGQTEHNIARIMAGSIDSKLTEKGKEQARALHNTLKNLTIKPTAIIHSNLSRARNTAEILNQVLNVPLYEDPDLAEWHAGQWEGASYEECQALLTDWITPPGGETANAFLTRIRRAKTKALSKHEKPVMIVSHGGVFRAFGKLYDINSYDVPNCTLYEFSPNHAQSQFPWDIWEHSYENEPVRKASMIYSEHFLPSDDIAS